jgi:ABC-type multidrug transport system permease subunit
MRIMLVSAVKDLRVFRRNAASVATWFVLPLVMVAVIGLVFGSHDVTPRGLLLIADEDHGLFGAFVRETIGGGDLGKIVAIQEVDRAAGRARLDLGDGSALLVIPKDFSDAVQSDGPGELLLVTNPEQRIVPAILREAISAMVEAASYFQQAGGADDRVSSSANPVVTALRDIPTLSRALGQAMPYLQPQRLTLKAEAIAPAGPAITVRGLLFPGTVLLVVLLTAGGMSIEIWNERAAFAVRRLITTPASISGFLAGKLAATAVILLAAVLITFLMARFLLDIPMRSPMLAIAWAAVCAIVTYLAMLIAQLLLASERTGSPIVGAIVFPLAILGGSFFPTEIFPERFVRISHSIPNGWMLVRLKSILAGSAGAAQMLWPFTILLMCGAVAFLLVSRLLVRRLA